MVPYEFEVRVAVSVKILSVQIKFQVLVVSCGILQQVWLCLGHACSDETNTCALPDDPFCFVYDERNKNWIQW